MAALALLTGIALGGASVAAATEPLPNVIAQGSCPSAELVRAALARRSLPESARDYRLVIEGTATGVELTLSNGAGTRVLERSIASEDCDALADAAAIITETYFVELAAREQGQNPAASANTPGPPEPAATALPPAAPAPPLPPVAPAAAAAPVGAAAVHAPTASSAQSPEHSATSTAGAGKTTRLDAALGGGVEALLDRATLSPALQGAVGARLFADRLHVELHALTATHATLGVEPNRVSRRQSHFAARVGPRLTRAFEPWVGAGAALARLRLIDLDNGPTRTRWSPIVELGFTFEYALSPSFALRSELGGHVFLIQERYDVTPDGRIGTGPRLGASLVVGVAWSSPPL